MIKHPNAIICEHRIPVTDAKTVDWERLWNSYIDRGKETSPSIIIVPCRAPEDHGYNYFFKKREEQERGPEEKEDRRVG
jgi:hypothetical protein